MRIDEKLECPFANSDTMMKLNRRAEASEYSDDELEIVIDVLANHYEDLEETWRGYYEDLLAAYQEGTK